MKNSIVLTGGGTAGHIMPLIAIAPTLKLHFDEVHYIGSNGMEKQLTETHNINFHEIPAIKFARKLTLKNLAIPFVLSKAISSAKKYLKKINPACIFSKGGYVALPVCLAGKSLKIPILTHESDITLGLANKIIAKSAKTVCVTFEDTLTNTKKNSNFVLTGVPIRNSFSTATKQKGLKELGIKVQSKPIIVVMGGSLGSKHINSLIRNNLPILTQKYIIVHIVGKGNLDTSLSQNENYIQIEFSQNIADIISASSMVVSRAGSNAINELLFLKKPMLLIPLSKAQSRGDQILNAQSFEKQGFASAIFEESVSDDIFRAKIDYVFQNRDKFIDRMKKVSIINAKQNIVNEILKLTK